MTTALELIGLVVAGLCGYALIGGVVAGLAWGALKRWQPHLLKRIDATALVGLALAWPIWTAAFIAIAPSSCVLRFLSGKWWWE